MRGKGRELKRARNVLLHRMPFIILGINLACMAWQLSQHNWLLALVNLMAGAGLTFAASKSGRIPDSMWEWEYGWREGDWALCLTVDGSTTYPFTLEENGQAVAFDEDGFPAGVLEELLSPRVDPLTAVVLVSECEAAHEAWRTKRGLKPVVGRSELSR